MWQAAGLPPSCLPHLQQGGRVLRVAALPCLQLRSQPVAQRIQGSTGQQLGRAIRQAHDGNKGRAAASGAVQRTGHQVRPHVGKAGLRRAALHHVTLLHRGGWVRGRRVGSHMAWSLDGRQGGAAMGSASCHRLRTLLVANHAYGWPSRSTSVSGRLQRSRTPRSCKHTPSQAQRA